MVAHIRCAGVGQIRRGVFDDGIEPIDQRLMPGERMQALVLMGNVPVSSVGPEVNQRVPVCALASSTKV